MANERSSWGVTTDATVALANNYLGEAVAAPRVLVQSIRMAFGLTPVPPLRLYFYGRWDNKLRAFFGMPLCR